MRIATTIGLGVLLLAGAARAQETTPRTDKTADTKADPHGLVGNYVLISGEDAGKVVPDEHIKGSTVRITANSIVVVDKADKEVYVADYTIESKTKPYKITMTETGGPRGRKGQKAMGLIEPEGDTVRLVYAYEGGVVPTEFKTRTGGKQLMFVMKRKSGE